MQRSNLPATYKRAAEKFGDALDRATAGPSQIKRARYRQPPPRIYESRIAAARSDKRPDPFASANPCARQEHPKIRLHQPDPGDP
jgi:hypothetical protein